MRFGEVLREASGAEATAALRTFDQAAWSLGFSTLSTMNDREPFDVEASVVMLTVLLGRRDLRLSRFVSVLTQWLRRYHGLVNPQKLLKIGRSAEKALGDLPLLRLAFFVLRNSDPKRFKKFETAPLKDPFYLDPRLRDLVDRDIAKKGMFLGLSPSSGLMFPEGAFKERDSDLLPEAALLSRNMQLRLRLLLGANSRSDAAYQLARSPDVSARQLARIIFLSYEPAHRLKQELCRPEAIEILRRIGA